MTAVKRRFEIFGSSIKISKFTWNRDVESTQLAAFKTIWRLVGINWHNNLDANIYDTGQPNDMNASDISA
jgi:hypothetical protein